MAPDMGTNEQTMAWMMDTYSVHRSATPCRASSPANRSASAVRSAAAKPPAAAWPTSSTAPWTPSAWTRQSHGGGAGLRQRRLRGRAIRWPNTASKSSPSATSSAAFTIPRAGPVGNWTNTPRKSGRSSPAFPARADHQRATAAAAVRHPGAGRAGTADHRSQRRQNQVPHPGRGRQRPDHAGGRRILDAAPGDFHHPGRAVQRRRRGGQYFEWVQDLQSFFWNETEVTDKLFRMRIGIRPQSCFVAHFLVLDQKSKIANQKWL
jgi:glutamate dehydrogenase (NAD(P)+)